MIEFRSELNKILTGDSIREQEPLKKHTTFRIGGPADYYVTPNDENQLAAVVKLCRQLDMPYYILGNGSNLLVSDKGYRGVIIAMGKSWDFCEIRNNQVIAGGGIPLYKLAKEIARESLEGFEFAAGIPGTLGGAMVMNAGAYGGELKDVLVSAKVMDPCGNVIHLPLEKLELGYRTSCILAKGYIVLEGRFYFPAGDREAIDSKMEEISAQRRRKQPLQYPSAGSTFKRPEGYFAGKLIDEAGLLGFQIGGAQVSEKHGGFVVNTGEATAADVLALCREVNRRVYEEFQVNLEMEVKILGEIQTEA